MAWLTLLQTIKCRVCGKIGHKGADCWTLEANKGKRPANYHGRENVETKSIVLQVIAATATRKDIENQNVILSRMTMQIMWKKDML